MCVCVMLWCVVHNDCIWICSVIDGMWCVFSCVVGWWLLVGCGYMYCNVRCVVVLYCS